MSAGFAKKVGMTRIFIDGKSVPVTVVQVLPSYVLQNKNLKQDGYEAVQIGAGLSKKTNKPALGHIQKNHKDLNSRLKVITEFKGLEAAEDKLVFDIQDFAEAETLKVTGEVKGRGFAGVIKRHGFAGQPASHGHDHKRAPGSIGSRWPQRVDKGKKMAGHMGTNQLTIPKVKIVARDVDQSLLFLAGSVPGANGGFLKLRKVS